MNYELKKVADNIIDAAIKAVLPDKAVIRALENKEFPGRAILVSVGKAAWQMANAASEYLGDRIDKGIVITKYGHVKGPIDRVYSGSNRRQPISRKLIWINDQQIFHCRYGTSIGTLPRTIWTTDANQSWLHDFI